MKKLLSAALLCLASALPALAQSETASSITIEGNDTQYATLKDAADAATDGQTILISGEAKLTSQLVISDKALTIKGVSDDAKIVIAKGAQIFKIQQADGATASLSLTNLEINANYTSNNLILLAAGSLNLENVVINGFTSNATNGIVRIYGASNATIDNVSFVDCATPETTPYNIVFATATGSLTLKGKCDYNLSLNDKSAFITDGGITSDSKVSIFYSNHTETIPVVKDCDDIFKFNLNVDGKMLSPKENSLYTVNKTNILLINEVDGVKTGTGYSALAGSAGAATNATTGAVIVVNENVNLTTSMNFAGKSIEIRGAKPDVAITLAADRALANAAAADTHIDIRDLAITPQAELAYTSFIAQATTSDASVSFQNVTFKDCNTTNAALIRANAGGVWHIDGVTFENCSVTPASKADGTEVTPLVLTNNPGCSVSGINNGLTIQVNNAGTNSIDAQGLEAGNEPIILTLSGAAHDHTLITNCENLSLFEITNSGWSFQADEQGGLKTLDRQIVTGVEEVAAEADGEAEYFDLRGVRVNAEALPPGLYICRKGGKVSKTVIR